MIEKESKNNIENIYKEKKDILEKKSLDKNINKLQTDLNKEKEKELNEKISKYENKNK